MNSGLNTRFKTEIRWYKEIVTKAFGDLHKQMKEPSLFDIRL